MEPGAIQKVLTLLSFNSTNNVLDSPNNACFDEQYIAAFLKPLCADDEAIFTIHPHFFSVISPENSLHRRNGALAFRFIQLSNSSNVLSDKGFL